MSQYPLGSLFSWISPLIIDDTYSPEGSLAKLPPAPLFVSHCETDALIPIRFGQKLFDEAKGPKTFWRIPDCKHARSFTNENQHNQKLLLPLLLDPSLVDASYSYQQAARTQPLELSARKQDTEQLERAKAHASQ